MTIDDMIVEFKNQMKVRFLNSTVRLNKIKHDKIRGCYLICFTNNYGKDISLIFCLDTDNNDKQFKAIDRISEFIMRTY